MSRVDCPCFDFFVSQRRVSKELRKPFVQPDRQVAEIQAQQRMRIFVVKRVKRIVAARIQSQDDVVLVFSRLIHSRMMNVAFYFPFFGQIQLYCVLVFCRDDDNGLRGIHPQPGEGGVEHLPYLLELVRNSTGVSFTCVGIHGEVWTSHFDPIVRRHCAKRQQK